MPQSEIEHVNAVLDCWLVEEEHRLQEQEIDEAEIEVTSDYESEESVGEISALCDLCEEAKD